MAISSAMFSSSLNISSSAASSRLKVAGCSSSALHSKKPVEPEHNDDSEPGDAFEPELITTTSKRKQTKEPTRRLEPPNDNYASTDVSSRLQANACEGLKRAAVNFNMDEPPPVAKPFIDIVNACPRPELYGCGIRCALDSTSHPRLPDGTCVALTRRSRLSVYSQETRLSIRPSACLRRQFHSYHVWRKSALRAAPADDAQRQRL